MMLTQLFGIEYFFASYIISSIKPFINYCVSIIVVA
jgi:hypothetical protein